MDEKSIFIEALQRDDPVERAAYLDAACADQPELRQRIEALLRRHDDAGSFLEKPPVEYLTPETVLDPDSHRPDIYGMAQPAAGQAPGEEPDLGFLDPCDKPDTLGQFGSYEILEVLGAGGMGVVLKARDPKLNRILAIKVLAPQFAANAMGRKRFLREGRAAAAISHDHIVSIHGINESEHLPFLMMEYVDGLSLQQRIDRDGPLELKEILRIGKQAALGLAAAHDQGLIHRDIKPSNILLENSVERVKITDFGLARAVDDVSITRTGVITGTPQYMSPEQAQNEPMDHRSDLFSLGSVLYAMCTGRPPFRGDSMVTVIRRVCDDDPRPIREVNSDIPGWLAAIIDRLLAKQPDKRFQSASEVAELLGQHLAHLQHPTVNPAPATPEWPTRRSGKLSFVRPWAIIALVLLLMVGSLGFTEATGVTEFVGTVIEIFTPRGTLVIDVDDPRMSVTVDQDGEELTVSDETHHVLTLRPGEVEVRAEKDGKEIHRQLATITRGGRRVVSIAISEPPPPPPAEDPSPEPETPAPPPTRSRLLADIQYSQTAAGFDVSPNGQRILGSTPWGKVALWDTSTGKELMSVEGHTGMVESVAYAPNGRFFASGGEDGTVKVWDANTGKECLALEGHPAYVRRLCFSPNSQWLATSGRDDQTIKLWDATTGRLQHTLKHPNYVKDLAFDADGKRIVAGGSILAIDQGAGADTPSPCVVKVWDVGTGEEIHELDFGAWGTCTTRFSPDGKQIACSGVGRIHVWDSETGSLEFTAKHRVHFGASVFSLSFRPDSRRLATAGANKEVVIWDTADGEELVALNHPDRLIRTAYSRDGNWIASGTKNGILTLWHAESGRSHLMLREHIGHVGVVRFTPDGRRIISAAQDGRIKVWDVSDITGISGERHSANDNSRGPSPQQTVDALSPITALATSTEENPIRNTARLLSLSVGDQQFKDLVFCHEAHETIRGPRRYRNSKTVTYTGVSYRDKHSLNVAGSMTDDDVSTGFSSVYLHSTLNLFFERELIDSNGTLPNVFLVEIGGDDTLSVQAIIGGTIQQPELGGSIVVLNRSEWGLTGCQLSGVANDGFTFTKPLCGVGIDIGAFSLPKGENVKGVQVIQDYKEAADLVLVAGSR